jgi:hypothetical protein
MRLLGKVITEKFRKGTQNNISGGEGIGEGVQRKGLGKVTGNKSALTQKSGKEFVEKGSKKERKEGWEGVGRISIKCGKISFSNWIRNLRNGEKEKEK